MYPMQKSIKNKIKCVPCIHVLKNQDNTRFKGKYNPPKIYLFLTHTQQHRCSFSSNHNIHKSVAFGFVAPDPLIDIIY